MAARLPVEDGPATAPPPGVRTPRNRKGGDAYAREWARVLKDNSNGKRDRHSTYTWELHTDPNASGSGRVAFPIDAQANPYDTYTWETPETENRDDPWGLKKKSEPGKPTPAAKGANPYDTGSMNPSWTGRFDQR
ncbi:MAG: hypothetical protein FJ197_06190 [Gammaproteobacteria bacterium]|nr:hypothetical protein [Gammaproteobacteria bacterium]